MLTWSYRETNGMPGEVIFAVFGGDPVVDMVGELRWWYTTIDGRCDIGWIWAWVSILQLAVTFSGMKGFLYRIPSSQTVVFHYTFDPSNQSGWEKATSITHIPPFIVTCSYTRILDRCSPSYASMTWKVIVGIWQNILRNTKKTICSSEVNTPRNITQTLCMYVLAT